MEMSQKEIVSRFEMNPKREQIKILAQLNDCGEYLIENILKTNGVEIPEKKKGRPKKNAAVSNNPSSDESKIPEDDYVDNNIELCEREIKPRPVPKYLIPASVQEMTKDKIEQLQRQIMAFCDRIDELNAEKHELEVFLKGEWKEDGKENKLLRKI